MSTLWHIHYIKNFSHPTVCSNSVSQTSFLEDPYGSCGHKDFQLYPDITYTTSHCQRECATFSLMDRCNCTEPYMDGNSTASMYYNSILCCEIESMRLTYNTFITTSSCNGSIWPSGITSSRQITEVY